jgi:hypothetical protein
VSAGTGINVCGVRPSATAGAAVAAIAITPASAKVGTRSNLNSCAFCHRNLFGRASADKSDPTEVGASRRQSWPWVCAAVASSFTDGFSMHLIYVYCDINLWALAYHRLFRTGNCFAGAFRFAGALLFWRMTSHLRHPLYVTAVISELSSI